MNYDFYKLEPGVCTAVVVGVGLASTRVKVRKVSGSGLVLEPSATLKENHLISVTLEFEGGPTLSLSALVVTWSMEGIYLEWKHPNPREAGRIDGVVREYLKERRQRPPAGAGGPGSPAGKASPPAEAAAPVAGPADARAGAAGSTGQPGATSGEPRAQAAQSRAPAAETKAPGGESKARVEDKARGEGQGKGAAAPSPARPAAEASRASPPPPAPHTTGKGPSQEPPQRGAKGSGQGPPARPAHQGPQHSKVTTDQPRAGTRPASSVPPGGEGASSVGLDVSASILKKAKRVRSKDLASRLETVQVLGMATIQSLIQEAVDEALVQLGERLRDEEKKRLLEEVEEGFKEKLDLFKSEKAGLEEKTQFLQRELEAARRLLEEERSRVLSANQFTVSDTGMMELEKRLGRILDMAIKKGGVTLELEEEMRDKVARLLDDERQKIRDQAQEAQSAKIALLEKKVGRLSSSLESTEKERDLAQRRAKALEAAGGIPLGNIFTAGLDEDDPNRERKLSLLKEIVNINRTMREELVANGVKLGTRRRPTPPEAQAGEPGAKAPEGPGAAGEKASASPSPAAAPTPEPAPARAPEAPQKPAATEEEGSGRETRAAEETEVPVLASGADADPDDLPWQPPDPEEQLPRGALRIRKHDS